MRALLGSAGVAAAIATTSPAFAEDPPGPPSPAESAAQVDLTRDTRPPAVDEPVAALAEAPPPPPYRRTVVLDSSIGAIGFLGQFRKVAPPGPWMRTQLGVELLRWLMLYAEGELAFSDTSVKQMPPTTRAFAMYGFGGGARFTIRFGERLGAYAQAGAGAMKANIATNALGLIGFRDAESLDLYLGARLGLEWFQIDRHFALGLTTGIRLAQGFAKTGASRDTPAALDGGVSLRYAF